MSKLLSSFDYITERPYLFINNRTRNQTSLGGFIFVLNVLAIFILSIYFGIKLFDRSTSNISYNLVPVTKNTSSLTANFTGRPFVITLVNTLTEILNDDGLYNIVGQITDFYLDESNRMTGKRTFFEMEKCNINKHFGQYQSYFSEVKELEKYFCLKKPNSEIVIKGIYGGLSRIFAFQIQKCVQDISKNITCLNEVDKILENINISIKFLDNQINHDKQNNPKELYLRSDTVTASSSVYKRVFYFMKSVQYFKDIGYVFEDNKSFEFYQFPDSKETVDLRSQGILPGNFVNVCFIMDNKIFMFKKSYMKLQNLLANVGGIIKLFTQVCYYLLITIDYKSYYQEVCKLHNNKESEMNQSQLNFKYIKNNNVIEINKSGRESQVKPLIIKVLLFNLVSKSNDFQIL